MIGGRLTATRPGTVTVDQGAVVADRKSVRVPVVLIVLAVIVVLLPDTGIWEIAFAAALFFGGIAVFVWQPKLRGRQRSGQ